MNLSTSNTGRLAASLLIVSLLCACGTYTVAGKIRERIERGCMPSAACLVRVRDLTDFEWDKMFVFEYGAELYDIETAIGTSYPGFVQFKRRIVFLKDGRIAHAENQPTDIEGHVDGEVLFGIPDTVSHRSYTPETAVFSAEKKTFGGGVYYELRQSR